MAYGSTSYVKMTPKKNGGTNDTLEMFALDQSTASMSQGLLTLLESIAKVPDWQSLKQAKSSIF